MDIKKTLTMPKGKFPMRANLPSWEGDQRFPPPASFRARGDGLSTS